MECQFFDVDEYGKLRSSIDWKVNVLHRLVLGMFIEKDRVFDGCAHVRSKFVG